MQPHLRLPSRFCARLERRLLPLPLSVYSCTQVNLLYLGLRVLALIDISYLSRFWTQFEAWLSMQEGSPDGLRPAPVSRRRVEMCCIHNATKGAEDVKLQSMWKAVTPDEAHALLSKPDVTVTNQSDKEMQLVKVKQLKFDNEGGGGDGDDDGVPVPRAELGAYVSGLLGMASGGGAAPASAAGGGGGALSRVADGRADVPGVALRGTQKFAVLGVKK